MLSKPFIKKRIQLVRCTTIFYFIPILNDNVYIAIYACMGEYLCIECMCIYELHVCVFNVFMLYYVCIAILKYKFCSAVIYLNLITRLTFSSLQKINFLL